MISEKFVFIRQSKYLLKRGLAEAALNNINKALDLEDQSYCCELLTIRSLCYLQLEYWQVGQFVRPKTKGAAVSPKYLERLGGRRGNSVRRSLQCPGYFLPSGVLV